MTHGIHCIPTIKTNLLMLFKIVNIVYSEDHNKPIYSLCWENAETVNFKAGNTHGNNYAFKG
jgi:hypothetical protein